MFSDLELLEDENNYLEQIRLACSNNQISEAERRRMSSAISIPSELAPPSNILPAQTTEATCPETSGGSWRPNAEFNLFSRGFHNREPNPQVSRAVPAFSGAPSWSDPACIASWLDASYEAEVKKGFGKWNEGKVTLINSPAHFYAHIGDLGLNSLSLFGRMNQVYSKSTPDRAENQPVKDSAIPPGVSSEFCFKGRLVAAQWDQDEKWYRALIQRTASEEESDSPRSAFGVTFVDYGNEAECSLKQLRPLHAILAAIPPLAIPCCLEACFSADDAVTMKEVFEENLTKKFGPESQCKIFLTGQEKTDPVTEEKVYCVKIGDQKCTDVSKELLIERPPSDPKDMIISTGKRQVGCVVELHPAIGRLILGNIQAGLAFFDENTLLDGVSFREMGEDLRAHVASGDSVEVVCEAVAGSAQLLYCTHMTALSQLDDDAFCDGHGVVTHVSEGSFATAVNTVQEKVLILPESLPQGDLMERILLCKKDPSLLPDLKLPSFSKFLFNWRTMEITCIPMPDFIKDRLNELQKTKDSCTKLALKVRPWGEVKEGMGRVKAHFNNGFVLESISEQLDDIWVPCGIFGRERPNFEERFPLGHNVAYEMCQELPERAFKWRAFTVNRNLVERSVAFANASAPAQSFPSPTREERKKDAEPLIELRQETEVKVIDDGAIDKGTRGVNVVEWDKADDAQVPCLGAERREPLKPVLAKPKTLEDLLSENLNLLTLKSPVTASSEGGRGVDGRNLPMKEEVRDVTGATVETTSGVAENGLADINGAAVSSGAGASMISSTIQQSDETETQSNMGKGDGLICIQERDYPICIDSVDVRNGSEGEHDQEEPQETEETMQVAETVGEHKDGHPVPEAMAVLEIGKGNGGEEESEAVKKIRVLQETMVSGTAEQKEAIRTLAKTPDLFRRLFLCDPPCFEE